MALRFPLVLDATNQPSQLTSADQLRLPAPVGPFQTTLLPTATADRVLTLPDATGVLALTSDLTAYQPLDATLTAITVMDVTPGLVVESSLNVFTKRTIAGTAAEVTVTNGDGVSGNPTLSLPAALTFTGKTVTGGTFNGVVVNATSIGATTPGSIAGTTGTFSSTLAVTGSITLNNVTTITTATAIGTPSSTQVILGNGRVYAGNTGATSIQTAGGVTAAGAGSFGTTLAVAGAVTMTAGTTSTSTTTGTAVITGGAGISGNIYVGGLGDFGGAVTATTGIAINRTGGNPFFQMTRVTVGGIIMRVTAADTIAINNAAESLAMLTIAPTAITLGSAVNLAMSGASTLTTGTGAVSLNGDTTIASGKRFGFGAVSTSAAVFVGSNSGVTASSARVIIIDDFSFPATATVLGIGVSVALTTANSVFTLPIMRGFNVGVLAKGASATVTNVDAFRSSIQTIGSNSSVGFHFGNGTAVAGSWGFYSSAATANCLGTGATLIGTTTNDGVNKLQVTGGSAFTGAVTISSTLQLGNTAVAATPTATHTVTMKDAAGATYRFLCVV